MSKRINKVVVSIDFFLDVPDERQGHAWHDLTAYLENTLEFGYFDNDLFGIRRFEVTASSEESDE